MNSWDDVTIDSAVQLILQGSVVVLSGAGASTESGIPDFRSKSGLWSRFDPMEYGTMGAFRKDPKKVWGMLCELLDYIDAEPNAGHRALAELEELGLIKGIITQNIDGLHQKAGSKNVVEFHGSPRTLTCLKCGLKYELAEVSQQLPPSCKCGELLKPDIVFFDETIPAAGITDSETMVANAETLFVIGTSCQVVPAAYFPTTVRARGGKIIELNLEPALSSVATVSLVGGFSKIMKELTRKIKLA